MSIDKQKLIEYLKEHNVALTKKNYVCLHDFVTNIIVSKNPKTYINNLTNYDKKRINGKKYVSLDDCINILYNCNFKRCKNTIKKIQLDKTSIIDIKNQVLRFEGFLFKTYFMEREDGSWDAWIQASQIVKYFGYTNTTQIINTYVKENDTLKYSQLCEIITPEEKPGNKKIIGSTIFINTSGFYDLCSGSTKKCATKIKKWLSKDVLPTLVKNRKLPAQKNLESCKGSDELRKLELQYMIKEKEIELQREKNKQVAIETEYKLRHLICKGKSKRDKFNKVKLPNNTNIIEDETDIDETEIGETDMDETDISETDIDETDIGETNILVQSSKKNNYSEESLSEGNHFDNSTELLS